MKVYGLISDNGDGSASLHWYSNGDLVDYLLEKDHCYMNEGSPAQTLTFPDDFDLESIGLRVDHSTVEKYKADYD